MELINATRMAAGYAMGLEPSGREHLIIAVKGTFRIPAEQGARLQLHDEQLPLVLSDVFHGAPGLSAPKYETDLPLRKHRCDILLNGSAHAPGGQPTDRVTVGIQVGDWSKRFAVVGDRVWFLDGVPRATAPVPFMTMPITYDLAFGGTDQRHEDPAQHAAFMQNPSGRGFHKHLIAEWLEGSPLPNTEELGVSVDRPDGNYRPLSFGPVGRHWEPRIRYAGTYDQKWLDDAFPFLPADFDDQYYQSAPLDQQLPPLAGDKTVTLTNLTPEGRRDFVLPHFEAPISFMMKNHEREDVVGRADTVVIEPDLERVTVTWRTSRPLRKNMFEVAEVLVGRKGSEWWQKREASFPIPIVVEPVATLEEGEAEPAEENEE
jgi:hypothetical protein